MKRVLIAGILVVVVLLSSVGGSLAEPRKVEQGIITNGPGAMDLAVKDIDLISQYLSIGKVLAADGSAVLYISDVLRNDGSTGVSNYTWCFGFSGSEYTNIFAEDSEGFLTIETYVDWWTGRTCVETHFRSPIRNGQEYWYGLGLGISKFASVDASGNVIASWVVDSNVGAQQYVDEVWWPSNRRAVTADPEPDLLSWSYAKWERTFEQAPWTLSISITVEPGTGMTIAPLSQGGQPWGSDRYGHGTEETDTIAKWGCMLTSATMAVNYYAQLRGLPAITPRDLNSALKDLPGGYSGHRGLLLGLGVVPAATKEIYGVDDLVHYDGPDTLDSVKDHLRSGRLPILGVDYGCGADGCGPGHYVLATGFTEEGGVTTYTVNDPLGDIGERTLTDGEFVTVQVLTPGNYTQKPFRMGFVAECPVELVITSGGLKTGYDPRYGVSYSEIPEAHYHTYRLCPAGTGDCVVGKVFDLASLVPGDYSVEVIGTGTGQYALDFVTFAMSGVAAERYEGTVVEGKVDVVNVSYDPILGILREIYLPLTLRQW